MTSISIDRASAQPVSQATQQGEDPLFRPRAVQGIDPVGWGLFVLVRDADAAVAKDNCIQKSNLINQLWAIYLDENHRFWVRHGLVGDSPSLNATRQKYRDYIYKEVSRINAIPCPKQTAEQAAQIQAFIAGGGIIANLPQQSFLARELQGSGVQELNQVQPSRRSTGASGQFKLEINNAPRPRDRIYFGFEYWKVDSSSSGAYDPGPGFRLNIPGAEGGASGVSLGGNPLNRVTNSIFSNNTESFDGRGGVRIAVGNITGGPSVDTIIGVGGSRLTSNQTFSGEIPGFGRVFSYTTDVDVNSARLDLGLGVTQVVGTPGGGIMIFNGEVTVSPSVLSANGTDRFNFTGITPSAADLDKTKADAGISVNGGLSFGLPGATVSGNRINGPSIFVRGGYESRPGFPVIVRDGTNPSRLDLKHADIFTVSGGVMIPFGGPSLAPNVISR